MKKSKAEQRSDDIIEWIVKHWKLFTTTKKEMQMYYSQLGQQTDYTVDALCDLLGIGCNIFFKRVTDGHEIGSAFANFKLCKLYRLFRQCKDKMQLKGPICLIVVKGESTIMITDMNTEYPDDTCYHFYRDADGYDINIFFAADAPKRLPNLFNPKEN